MLILNENTFALVNLRHIFIILSKCPYLSDSVYLKNISEQFRLSHVMHVANIRVFYRVFHIELYSLFFHEYVINNQNYISPRTWYEMEYYKRSLVLNPLQIRHIVFNLSLSICNLRMFFAMCASSNQ